MRISFGKLIKGLRFFTHPVLVISIFLILPIIPGQMDKFYFNFILQGLLEMKVYALSAVAGITVLIYSFIKFKIVWDVKELLRWKGAWFNMAGMILILFSLASFYSLESTPYFRESLGTIFSCFTFFYFFLTCHLFDGLNLTFVIMGVADKYQDKSDYYDEDELYGGDFDDYIEL